MEAGSKHMEIENPIPGLKQKIFLLLSRLADFQLFDSAQRVGSENAAQKGNSIN